MGSALPTVHALRGKGERKIRERKGNYCPNNTRKCQKIPTHDNIHKYGTKYLQTSASLTGCKPVGAYYTRRNKLSAQKKCMEISTQTKKSRYYKRKMGIYYKRRWSIQSMLCCKRLFSNSGNRLQ
jgi:hypothetical protein